MARPDHRRSQAAAEQGDRRRLSAGLDLQDRRWRWRRSRAGWPRRIIASPATAASRSATTPSIAGPGRKRGHGTLDLEGGIKNRCDVFFYETARRAGHRQDRGSRRASWAWARPPASNCRASIPASFPARAWKQKTLQASPGSRATRSASASARAMSPPRRCSCAARRRASPAARRWRRAWSISVGGKVMPRPRRRQLDFSDEALARVRDGMNQVTNEPGGTAYSLAHHRAGLRNGGQDRHRPGARL